METKEELKELHFYKEQDGENKVDPELYDTVARSVASGLVGKNNRINKLNGVSRHQLRSLFDETKRIKRRLENPNTKWADVEPAVKLLKSKTSYAVARAKSNSKYDSDYYDYLKKFMHTGIDKIHNENDFNVFCNLFEAVYGFYYEMGGAQTS